MSVRQSKEKPHPQQGPAHRVEVVPIPKRVRVLFNQETIADSTQVLLLRETYLPPVYYFPPQDVRMEWLQRTDHSSHCPFKGEAAYWSVTVRERSAENGAWSYPEPLEQVAPINNHIAFYWDKMDAWYEEDEPVFVHPCDPYVRIDVRESFRPVRVVLGGKVVAETCRARFLFETGLPTRYYIPQEDVQMDWLEPSETHTACPYKGKASYWSVRIGDQYFKDLVWSYPDPLPEASQVKNYLAFYQEKVEAFYVDEELQRTWG
ncbi:DUF427 domain-containing protein [Nitrosococcus wardiae]|uniref:DUF427 domain-containing protein n=1 Tax=Nitrosococcus wardiae TaxID=1814290 RepID=A0A4P7BXN0_9GAMM|nr:DUF427 domain-containing protein [Nitrosococcus wardiae]QBQ53949.1 DUF427 domain-containing protein [Nitrosococcus wardiae]